MQTITTNVYTLDELKTLGDSRAVERARDWVRASEWDSGWGSENISEQLTEALREAFGPDAAVTGWDYARGQSVTIGGRLARPAGDPGALSARPDGIAFKGWRLPLGGYDATPRDAEIMTEWPAAGSESLVIGRYSERWQGDAESWATVTDEHHDQCESYVREIESVLSRLMAAEVEYRSSDEYVDESADANEWTFTDTGERFG